MYSGCLCVCASVRASQTLLAVKSIARIFTKLTALVRFGTRTNASSFGCQKVKVEGHRAERVKA